MYIDNFNIDENKLKHFKKAYNISANSLEAVVNVIIKNYNSRAKYFKSLINDSKFLELIELESAPLSEDVLLKVIFGGTIYNDMQRTIDSCIDDLLFLDYCNLNWR